MASSGGQSSTPVGSNHPVSEQVVSHVNEDPIDTNLEKNANDDGESSSPNKRGLKSTAWLHFKRQKIDDKWRAICKYCNRTLGGDTRVGTKHLHDHIATCKLRTVRGPKQSTIRSIPSSNSIGATKGDTIVVGSYTFNQETARKELATMIILHEYPLSMVEHVGFKRFCSALQPVFKVISRNTVKNDIMKIYDSEQLKTRKLLSRNSSRIAITTDLWTSSNQNKGYMAITAHFIDDSWNLQSRIVRFIYMPAPHTAENLCDTLVECLVDWNLDRKLSTLTVDNCSTNDAMIDHLFDKIPHSSFILGGTLFHMRCCAHILNLIVKDGMSTISESIRKIRESVAFWVATPKREERFEETCSQLEITYSKKLALDCKTRWNSTYLMLASAIPYEKVFNRCPLRDPQYKCLPTEQDWIMAKEICDRLELFYGVTELFSGTRYPTANVYFPKICEVRLTLREWITCGNSVIQEMAKNMIGKFDKYWGVINGVMAVGAVLDPRYKMMLLNYFFPHMYGDGASSELKRVQTICQDLVKEYEAKSKTMHQSDSATSSISDTSSMGKKIDWKCNFVQFVNENSSTYCAKSELDYYLEEPVLPSVSDQEFDILAWWKTNGLKYPTLQRIAKDFLAIPISTVASESAFSTSGRFLSPHRSRLHEKTIEALMCTQDWLWSEIEGSSKVPIPPCWATNGDMDVDDESSVPRRQ